MNATEIPFKEVVGSFSHDQIRMYADRNGEGDIDGVVVYEIAGTLAGVEGDEWNHAGTEIYPILGAARAFDGFRHVKFLGEDPVSNIGYFNYQRMDVMAEICMKLHELGPIE